MAGLEFEGGTLSALQGHNMRTHRKTAASQEAWVKYEAHIYETKILRL